MDAYAVPHQFGVRELIREQSHPRIVDVVIAALLPTTTSASVSFEAELSTIISGVSCETARGMIHAYFA